VENPTLTRLLHRLRHLREIHDLTQESFAELSGITYKYYQQIEAGRKPDLRLSTLERLAQAYGLEVHQLLSPAPPKTRLKKRVPKKTS
jgi:transcriptional regulator with XRE-family HTH domain